MGSRDRNTGTERVAVDRMASRIKDHREQNGESGGVSYEDARNRAVRVAERSDAERREKNRR